GLASESPEGEAELILQRGTAYEVRGRVAGTARPGEVFKGDVWEVDVVGQRPPGRPDRADDFAVLRLGAFADFDPAKHPKDEKGRWAETGGGEGIREEEHHWWQKLI